MTTQEVWALLHTGTGSPDLLRRARAELGCPVCLAHFDEYVRRVPPVYGAAWFPWTVAFHNEVNERLGKPIVSVENARRLWLEPASLSMSESGSAWSSWFYLGHS